MIFKQEQNVQYPRHRKDKEKIILPINFLQSIGEPSAPSGSYILLDAAVSKTY